MEKAAKNVIADENIPDTCKALMLDYPSAGVDIAISQNDKCALMALTVDGEAHVVDKLCAAKTMYDKLAEQPNGVVGADLHVSQLKKEIAQFSEFFEAFAGPVMEWHIQVIQNVLCQDDLIQNNDDFVAPGQIKCMWKLLKTWKAGGENSTVIASSFTEI